MRLIFIQKFNEKATKAKKKSNPACIFLHFHFIFSSFIFVEKNTENYTVINFCTLFFGVKKTLYNTPIFQNTAQCFFVFLKH
jgi:hypothetical protein